MARWGSKQFFSIIILLTVLFSACSGKEGSSEDVLSNEDMVHMMIQIHLLEAKVGRIGVRTDSAKVLYKHFEKVMFEEEGTDSVEYFESYEYYTARPKLFVSIYEAVVDSLLEMEIKEKARNEWAKKKEELKQENLGDTIIGPILKERPMMPKEGTELIEVELEESVKESQIPNKLKRDSLRKPRKLKFDAKQPK